ncbi:hypothetical protein, partial [Rhizobium sp. RAF56]|uniref:hypothetical protein n=1 Tax=Rhizobium sp. RAF56 TaxID=3233062 RepID=UPI003F95CFF9
TTAFQQPSQSAATVPSETLERRTSSPAAPPPSSVIGLIDPTPFLSQQHHHKKIKKTANMLKDKGDLLSVSRSAVYGRTNPAVRTSIEAGIERVIS